MDLSIVIPCLNEEETIEICVNKSFKIINELNISGEVIVADNGSIDNSKKISLNAGAKVVNVKQKGYGSAIRNGIREASGKYVIIADADNSYDFLEIEKFYNKLIQGFDIVQGCRFPIGGGTIKKDAMPISHMYIGNPLFSILSKLFFSLPFNDVYCGFRGFDRQKFLKLNHFSTGMVFAIENLIKFKVANLKCAEVPITLHKDGRKKNKSHLNTISDGWLTLRFLIVTCPKWLFFFPSFLLLFFSVYNVSTISNINFKYVDLDKIEIIGTSMMLFLLSFQIFMFGLYSSLTAIKLKMLENKFIDNFFKFFKLRYAILISLIIFSLLVVDYFFYNYLLVDYYLKKLLYFFGCFFSTLLLSNSFFISLITFDQ